MKILWNWLLELCDLERVPSVDEAAASLTAAGLEVETVTDLRAGFSGVVVAEVVARRPHPGSDKLRLVDVITAVGGPVTQVVCGAPNVPEPGGRVVWAQPGARLPGGVTLATKPVKGIDSPGMLCAEDELGIGDGADGIIVLDGSTPTVLGAPAYAALGVDDWLLDLGMPANRPDLLGHLGVARELCARFGGQVRLPVTPETAASSTMEAPCQVHLDDADAWAYVACKLEGVRLGPSSRRMAQRLRAVGVRPISNVVDVTNYVMFELGHPLHAFDAERLQGKAIQVRRARLGETLTTLDGIARTLSETDLVIADASRPVALAGVMGGHDSEVHEGTQTVLLEAAVFAPAPIRRTARRLNLHSEASLRFERGVDQATVALASQRAVDLLAQQAGARLVGPVVTVARPLPAPRTVSLRLARLTALLGAPVTAGEATTALTRLGFAVVAQPDRLEVTIASHRGDVTREADLIEEVVRTIGLDRVPTSLPALRQAPVALASSQPDIARQALAAMGCSEAITFAFQSYARLGWLGLSLTDRRNQPVAVKNPMSIDQAIMRTSLLPNLLAALARNQSHGRTDVALFEVGSVFLNRGSTGTGSELADEPVSAAVVLTGDRVHRLGARAAWDAHDACGLLRNLLETLCGRDFDCRWAPAAAPEPYLHPGVQTEISHDGVRLAVVGELHPRVRATVGLDQPVFIIELALAALPARPVAQMRAIPRFPSSSRDVSLLLPETVPAQRVADAIAAEPSPLRESFAMIDEYRDAKLPAGTKSQAWTIRYRHPERTLTDAEVEAAHEAIVAVVRAQVGAERR